MRVKPGVVRKGDGSIWRLITVFTICLMAWAFIIWVGIRVWGQ